jgi:hypothetical protein
VYLYAIVANIPDVTRVPYLTSASELATLVGLPLASIAPLLGVADVDAITPDGLGLAGAIVAGLAPGPLPADVVLTAAEAIEIRAAIGEYNTFIAMQVGQYGATLVDVHELFKSSIGGAFQYEGECSRAP